MSRNEHLTAHWPGAQLLEKMNMDAIEELLEAFRTLYASLEKPTSCATRCLQISRRPLEAISSKKPR